MSNISISYDCGKYSVILDGQEITNALRGVDVSVEGPPERPRVALDLLVKTTRLELADARVNIPDATREALVKLGWTPPREA